MRFWSFVCCNPHDDSNIGTRVVIACVRWRTLTLMCLGGLVVLGERGFVGPSVWSRSDDKAAPETSERLAGIPIACLELLGQSALQRTVQYLRHAGAEAVSLVAKDNVSHLVALA